MKKALFWWKRRSSSFCFFPSAGEFGKFISIGKKNFKRFWPTGIQTSKQFEWKKPHRLFQLGFLLLLLWGLMPPSHQPISPYPNWTPKTAPPCEASEDGFYLAEGEEISIEFYHEKNHFFAPSTSEWPEKTKCTRIHQPTKIEEI